MSRGVELYSLESGGHNDLDVTPTVELGVLDEPAVLLGGDEGVSGVYRWHRLATIALVGAGVASLFGGVASKPPGPMLVGKVAPAAGTYNPADRPGPLVDKAGVAKPALSDEVPAPPVDGVQRELTNTAVRVAREVVRGYESTREDGTKRQNYATSPLHNQAGAVRGYTLTEFLNGASRAQVSFGSDGHGDLRLDQLEEVEVWDASGGTAEVQLLANGAGRQGPPVVWRMIAGSGSWETVYIGANGVSITPMPALKHDLQQLQTMYP